METNQWLKKIFFEIKEIVEELMFSIGLKNEEFKKEMDKWFHNAI